MASVETSPTNQTYLVGVSAPQTVVQAAGNLMGILKRSALIPEQSERSTLGYFRASEGTNGIIPRGFAAEGSRASDSGSRAEPWGMIPFITSPLPPLIPILESSDMPPIPVPGLLPICTEPLILGKQLSLDTAETQGGWIVWPVESSGWFDSLAEALAPVGVSDHESESLIYPLCEGIPLARESNGMSPEVNCKIENVPGWRALNLVCWSIEYLTERPWYMSAAWYPLWHRRLKRAPKPTNNNK